MLRSNYYPIGLVVYVATIVIASALLLIESVRPMGLDAQTIITPLIATLFISSLGIGYKVAGRASTGLIAILGTVALATLFTFVGFFVVAAVAWCIALAHAS